ncbi:MAG: sulfatase [Lentisphaerae bacterium]|nr:sulfatase [Lentisphaerota bacterium]
MRVLFIDIDTLRPDHLGCYGYHRNTSPNIDGIASEGIRFDNYYTSDAPCLPSRAALVTGQFGIHTGVVEHGGICADLRPEGPDRSFQDRLRWGSLWAQFLANDHLTASVSSFPGRHAAWWFTAGLNQLFDNGKGGGESAEDVTPLALDWIDHNADKEDWLLHVHYWDPHTPYRAPAEFGNPFEDEPLPDYYTDELIESWQSAVGTHGPWELCMFDDKEDDTYPRHPGKVLDRKSVRRMVDGYDCGVRYTDDHVGKLLDALRAKGVLDDCVIIVTSDHGENLGELECCGEHATADHATCRIPMIIRWPGRVTAGTSDSGLHYNLDLAPTLAEMCNFNPIPFWDGRSFAATLESGFDTGRDQLIISQCCHGIQRSVRWDDWLYIRTYHDFYHLWPREMLFNLKDDPYEQNNLASDRPDLCREAAHRYLEWHDEMMRTSTHDSDPLWTVANQGGPYHSRGKLPGYCKRLEDTGRGWAVEELKRRHPQEFE